MKQLPLDTVWNMLFTCYPKDMENFETMTDDQASRLLKCFWGKLQNYDDFQSHFNPDITKTFTATASFNPAPESDKLNKPEKPLTYWFLGGLFKKKGDWQRVEKVLDIEYVQPSQKWNYNLIRTIIITTVCIWAGVLLGWWIGLFIISLVK
jgi:hypothetical protein